MSGLTGSSAETAAAAAGRGDVHGSWQRNSPLPSHHHQHHHQQQQQQQHHHQQQQHYQADNNNDADDDDDEDRSPLERAQQQYWTAKQSVLRRLGRRQDECVVADDWQLDAKLELFASVGDTCRQLHRVLAVYQQQLCVLSQEEHCLGRFLKEQGRDDKTRAGKMMIAVGKTVAYTAQQRLELRTPLARLSQEVETFHERAVQDTAATVRRMEKSRNEYRGSLLWMKDISQQLDPDTGRHLDRFRKVQGEVKRHKRRFDQLKLDCVQKVDLLAASRANMFSHALLPYHSRLLLFWQKTARTMQHVADCFTGYQYYEFNVVRELCEPSRRLADQTSTPPAASAVADSCDREQAVEGAQASSALMTAQTGGIDNLLLPEDAVTAGELLVPAGGGARGQSAARAAAVVSGQGDSDVKLLDLDDSDTDAAQPEQSTSSLGAETGASAAVCPPSAPSTVANLVYGGGSDFQPLTRQQQASHHLASDALASLVPVEVSGGAAASGAGGDGEVEEDDDGEDSVTMLEKLLASPQHSQHQKTSKNTADSQLTMEDLFGGLTLDDVSQDNTNDSSAIPSGSSGFQQSVFLPSQLLTSDALFASVGDKSGAADGSVAPLLPQISAAAPVGSTGAGRVLPNSGPASTQKKSSEMSAWFDMFAELDPLANPDAIGVNQQRDQQRNC